MENKNDVKNIDQPQLTSVLTKHTAGGYSVQVWPCPSNSENSVETERVIFYWLHSNSINTTDKDSWWCHFFLSWIVLFLIVTVCTMVFQPISEATCLARANMLGVYVAWASWSTLSRVTLLSVPPDWLFDLFVCVCRDLQFNWKNFG